MPSFLFSDIGVPAHRHFSLRINRCQLEEHMRASAGPNDKEFNIDIKVHIPQDDSSEYRSCYVSSCVLLIDFGQFFPADITPYGSQRKVSTRDYHGDEFILRVGVNRADHVYWPFLGPGDLLEVTILRDDTKINKLGSYISLADFEERQWALPTELAPTGGNKISDPNYSPQATFRAERHPHLHGLERAWWVDPSSQPSRPPPSRAETVVSGPLREAPDRYTPDRCMGSRRPPVRSSTSDGNDWAGILRNEVTVNAQLEPIVQDSLPSMREIEKPKRRASFLQRVKSTFGRKKSHTR